MPQETTDQTAETKTETPAEETPTQDKATEQQPEVKTPESTPQSKSEYIDLPLGDGTNVQLTAAELMEVAQHGYRDLLKPKDKEPEVKEDQTVEDKFDALNKDFQEYKAATQKKEQQAQIHYTLNETISKSDFLKDNSDLELVDGIKEQALAKQTLNPRMSLQQATIEVIQQRQTLQQKIEERFAEKMKANGLVKSSMSGTPSGGGGVPAIDVDKKYTFDDVRDGKSLNALRLLMDQE